MSTASIGRGGRSSGMSRRACKAGKVSSRRFKTVPTTSSSEVGTKRGVREPDSRAAMRRRLFTRAESRLASWWMLSRSWRQVSLSACFPSVRSVSADPAMAASGVRKSCVTVERSVARIFSRSVSTVVALAASSRRSTSRARAVCLAQASSNRC